ncbi:MAG TPA: YihY/virulence factor BrkB family protein [Tepidisphaeraceae bacterium]|jgi:membrane protein
MARLREVGTIIKKVGFWKFIWRVYQRMNQNNLLIWACALAYSWLFSVFPFLIFLLTLVPYLPVKLKAGTENRIKYVIMQLPPRASETVWGSVSQMVHRLLHEPPRGLFSTGLIVMIWAASSGMSMTMQALDRCQGESTCRPYYRQRALAILLTIIEVALFLCVLILLPVGTLLLEHIQQVLKYTSSNSAVVNGNGFLSVHGAVFIFLVQILRFIMALALLFSATALIYYFGPSVRRKFHWITPGGLFTITVWLVLGELFRFYVNHFGKGYQMYGALGGVAILLLFFYIDAAVLLIGAEINYTLDSGGAEPKTSALGGGDKK